VDDDLAKYWGVVDVMIMMNMKKGWSDCEADIASSRVLRRRIHLQRAHHLL